MRAALSASDAMSIDEGSPAKILAFPNPEELVLSIRAKALVFSDPESRRLLQSLQRIAPSDATVLLIGDTGTGKELVARYIHEQSGRSGPFVAVNCGAFSESLVEAELFGHESGAFTGAQQARAGWFEAANRGTLFLDEVGDLPLALQVKLLRVLQERQIVRLGSRKPIPLDVRIVAATNVDLDKAVKAGRFRLDLYYRLNVAPLHLPPLRQRRGDIMPLARHFTELYRSKLQLPDIVVSKSAQRALLEYDWPGNIRELENVIHFALIMCGGGVVEVEHLRLSGQSRLPSDAAEQMSPLDALQSSIQRLLQSDQKNIHDTVQSILVASAFDHCSGNQVRAAARLGISRNIFRAQMKRFGLLSSAREDVQRAVV